MPAPKTFVITVENSTELLNAGMFDTGAVIRVQSATTEGGAYADLTGTGSTPTIALVAGTRRYTAYDPSGEASTWYRYQFENSGATRTSGYFTSFQVDEAQGLLCSLYDVKQRLFPSASAITAHVDDEQFIDFIRDATRDIEGFARRWFVPRPLSGTTTYRLHARSGLTLWVPKGIRSITTLGVATEDQPSSGGTYTTATSTDYYIDPPDMARDEGWPGTRIVFRNNAAGSATYFYDASFGAEIVGTFGWSAVPPEIKSMAERYVVKAYQGKGSGVQTIATGEFEARLINLLAPDDMNRLGMYRDPVLA